MSDEKNNTSKQSDRPSEHRERSSIVSILQARNLRVTRAGVTILDIPELMVREGEVLSLIGPNGAGKTTLLQNVCHLHKRFEGEILFKGKVIGKDYEISDYRQRVAMVFQEPLLFDTTVFKNVASGLKFRGVVKRDIERRVGENLERFGISHLRDRSARTLSGGEAQRTSLARAFATRPEILFLDEPFASLDPPTREGLTHDLEKILLESQTTTISATHDRNEALRLSDRIAFMRNGKIEQLGTPAELVNHPVDEFVASFVGVETVLTGNVVGKGEGGTWVVSVSGKNIEVTEPLGEGETVVLHISPENVILSDNFVGKKTSIRNYFTARITCIMPLGPFIKVFLDCGFPLVAYITNESRETLALSEEKEVMASFKATAVQVIARKEPEID
jgi:tungstate transport system ATP-binding protein